MMDTIKSTPFAGRKKLIIIGSFATVYFIWGSTYLAIKVAVDAWPPFSMAGTRFILAGGLMVLFGLLRGERPAAGGLVRAAILGALFFALGNGSITWAESVGLPTSTAALLVTTVPLFIVLLGWALNGDAPGRIGLIGIAIGFAGTTMLVGANAHAADAPIVPALVALSGAFCWALGSILSTKLRAPAPPVLASGMMMSAGGGLLWCVAAIRGEPMPELSTVAPLALFAFVYLVVFGTIIAFTAYRFLLANVRATVVGTYAYVNPLVAVCLGWAIAGEGITGRSLVAMALIILSVVVVNLRGRWTARVVDQSAPKIFFSER